MHPGSYRADTGGDSRRRSPETKGLEGRSASTQAATQVKPEQAPKVTRGSRPDIQTWKAAAPAWTNRQERSWRTTGVMGAGCVQGELRNTRDLLSKPKRIEEGAARAGVGGAHSTCEAGNDRGGKGPWFRVLLEEWTSGRLARAYEAR